MGLPVGVVGQIMTGAELTEWAAFEEINGPILVHDHIDFGMSQVAYITARAAGSNLPPTAFLPPWLKGDTVRTTFEQLLRVAEANEHASPR